MKSTKICKGINKAHGFDGCGKEVETATRKYGLCPSCFWNWMQDTPEGKDHYENQFLYLISKKKKIDSKKSLDKIRENLETKSDLEKKLQKEINSIVRILDFGHECISSGRPLNEKYDAGHLFTTQANPTIRFHLFNIFAQSVHDNRHLSGNEINYVIRLGEVFTEEVKEYVLSLRNIKPIHLTKDDLKEKIQIAKQIVKRLKKQNTIYSLRERIELRIKINEELGIYDT